MSMKVEWYISVDTADRQILDMYNENCGMLDTRPSSEK